MIWGDPEKALPRSKQRAPLKKIEKQTKPKQTEVKAELGVDDEWRNLFNLYSKFLRSESVSNNVFFYGLTAPPPGKNPQHRGKSPVQGFFVKTQSLQYRGKVSHTGNFEKISKSPHTTPQSPHTREL